MHFTKSSINAHLDYLKLGIHQENMNSCTKFGTNLINIHSVMVALKIDVMPVG